MNNLESILKEEKHLCQSFFSNHPAIQLGHWGPAGKILPNYQTVGINDHPACDYQINTGTIPLKAEFTQRIVIAHALEQTSQWHNLIGECRRILVDGGYLLILCSTGRGQTALQQPHCQRLNIRAIKEVMMEDGLSIQHVTPYFYPSRFSLLHKCLGNKGAVGIMATKTTLPLTPTRLSWGSTNKLKGQSLPLARQK